MSVELDLPNQSDQSIFEKITISDAITQFIISGLQPPGVVEIPWFQRLVATLKSPCEIPSKLKLIEDVIPKLYDTYRLSILENLSLAISDISLSIEEWESADSQTYVTISAHFQQTSYEDELQSKVLSTIHCSQLYNSHHWNHILNHTFNDWNIQPERVKAIIIATHVEALVDSLRSQGFILVPCLTFTLQNVCMNSCFKLSTISYVIDKVRCLIFLIYRNSTALSRLRFHEQVSQLEELPLSLDYPKIWISTYMMLEQFLAYRNIIKSLVDVIGTSLYEKEIIDFTENDWSVIEDTVAVLECFKVTMMTLAVEKAPLVSLLKPLLWQLIYVHLKVQDETDSSLSKELKVALSNSLKETYRDQSVDMLLNISTTLDPRFKSLPYLIEESRSMLRGPIKTELSNLIKYLNNSCKQENYNLGNQEPIKKARVSGLEFLLGNVCSSSHSATINEPADLEINQYSTEPTANLDYCPLQWWHKSANKFAHLANIAYRYNCVPASAIPPSRIPVESQISYDKKRRTILPELVDRMIFLNANWH